jgi:hypothetical protein
MLPQLESRDTLAPRLPGAGEGDDARMDKYIVSADLEEKTSCPFPRGAVTRPSRVPQ